MAPAIPTPHNQLSLPSSRMHSTERAGDVYEQLLKERIVFLGSQVDQNSANLV
ncbi:MAG: ATP-dependent Clp protease proteolytic subunit, partial [Acidimicrobiales bacterium]